MTERRRCKAVNSRGERDKRVAMPGSDYCRYHTPPSGAAERAGLAPMLAGEHGPEIAHLPAGAPVIVPWADRDER